MARLTLQELEKIKKDNNVSRLWSWSRIHSFNISPYEYYLKYIKKVKEDRPNCIYAPMGGIAHDIIEKFYLGQIEYEEMSSEFADGWLTNREIANLKFDRNDEEHDEKIAKKYYADLMHFFNTHTPLKHKPALERFVQMKISSNVLYGYIDCCFKDDEGNFNIVDWKTSTIYRGKKANDECGQLVLYAIALNQMGIPFEKIKICWNFLKYCTVKYEQANGVIKQRDIERCKLGNTLCSNARMWLNKLGYANVADEYLKKMIDSNSLDVLPDDVRKKYAVSDCYVFVELTQELINKWTDYVISTIQEIIKREREYFDTQDDTVFFDTEEHVKEESYYFATLCGYSPSLHSPYKKYLNNIDSCSSVSTDDLSWLNDIV